MSEQPPGRDMPAPRALGVETVITPERGQWAVDIVVLFPDGMVRRRIATYRTEALARISASCIKRGAERDIDGPING
jgi:hypothetical protein